VVFEEEMRVKKEKGALELASLKKKEELDYNNLLMPFVENIENREPTIDRRLLLHRLLKHLLLQWPSRSLPRIFYKIMMR